MNHTRVGILHTLMFGAMLAVGSIAHAQWTTTTADGIGNVGEFTSLAVVNGNPAICYRDVGFATLKYVRAINPSGTAWGTPVTIDSIGFTGDFTSLAVVNGNPAISYYDSTNFHKKILLETETT